MNRKTNFVTICLICALVVAFIGGPSNAQQATSNDAWHLAPPNSLFVAVCDVRPGNASMQAITKTQDPQVRELWAQQQVSLRKAVEDITLLFGISLDFAKDIQSWADEQWVVVVVPDDKNKPQPVFMIASKDAVAADACLQKMLEPWQRIGSVVPQLDSDYRITAFRMKDKGIEVYASASGPVVAFSPSKACLKQALKGGGFAAGSPGGRVFNTLSGSLLCVFADPKLLKEFQVKAELPMSALGLGVSAVETGVKVRVLGLPTEQGAKLLSQMLAEQQHQGLMANPGIPSASLAVAALPDLNNLSVVVGMMGMSKHPAFAALQAISDTQISAAMTAALPMPAGVVLAMADSDRAASEKLSAIAVSARLLKLPMVPAPPIAGVQSMAITVSDGRTLFLAQIGKYVVLASDGQSLGAAAATIRGERPNIGQSDLYRETIAGLGDSNLLTLYVNLAPLQGVGYLVNGLGIGQVQPIYGIVAKSLEYLQALGVGVGISDQSVGATVFLRAKPGLGAGIGPIAFSGAAIGAAVIFPAFASARDAARVANCQSNLKQLSRAAMDYAGDHGGRLPTAAAWRIQLKPYVQSDLKCPEGGAVYAFNKNLGGLILDRIKNPSGVVMFFEATSVLPNASGSRSNAKLPHGGRGGVFAFADGHVRSLTEVPPQSQWVPRYAAPKSVKKAPSKKAPPRARSRR